MITASHNPVHDNGFKFFNSNGNKLQKSDEEIIEGLIEIKEGFLPNNNFRKTSNSAKDLYFDHLIKNFPKGILKGKKIVADLANGATKETTPGYSQIWVLRLFQSILVMAKSMSL